MLESALLLRATSHDARNVSVLVALIAIETHSYGDSRDRVRHDLAREEISD